MSEELSRIMSKHTNFQRGYEFKNFGGQPEEELIRLEIPARVTIPLAQGVGGEVAAVIKPGQKVGAGQIIGRDDELVSSPVHSSVNGEVVDIARIDHLGRETGAVIIDSDGTDGWQKIQGCSSAWEELPAKKIGELIYLSGASSAGKTGIPTAFNSSTITPEEVEDVIIQGVGSEVHNLSLEVLLQDERLSFFVEGVKILRKMMVKARFHLVLDRAQKSLVDKISQLLPTEDLIGISTVARKYPVEHDETLVPLLLGRKITHGYSATSVGAVVLDIQAVLQAYEAVVEGKPVIERMVALCGSGLVERPHVKARLGTSLEDVIKGKVNADTSVRFVLNSCLIGQSIPDLSGPIDRTFTTVTALLEENERQFLAFARPGLKRDSYSRTCLAGLFTKSSKMFQKTCGTNVHGELRPCIFCTFCEEVCPAEVIPHLLFHHVEKDIIDESLLKYEIFDCIECNLCSYVCPSKIPLVQYIKEGKARLLEEGFECPGPEVAAKGVEGHTKAE